MPTHGKFTVIFRVERPNNPEIQVRPFPGLQYKFRVIPVVKKTMVFWGGRRGEGV